MIYISHVFFNVDLNGHYTQLISTRSRQNLNQLKDVPAKAKAVEN